jgi:hypothetical protein
MAIPGSLFGSGIGADMALAAAYASNTGPSTSFGMETVNEGIAFRFTATQAKDVKTVRVRWATVTAAGQVTVRVETIDATTGKPTGTLYDANAVLTAQVPTAGPQDFTFSPLPTTNMTAGTEYAVVIICTTGGTAHAISYDNTGSSAAYPTTVLTAADATTRSNLTEAVGGRPVCSLILDDDTEDPMGMLPYTSVVSTAVHGTNAFAGKIVVPTGMTLTPAGIETSVVKTGTPAGDLRVRIFDSGDATVSNSTVTLDKDSLLTNASARRTYFPFTTLPSLTAGTYRIVFDSSASANSSNCWTFRRMVAFSSAATPSGITSSTTADVTAGPITWSDAADALPPIAVVVDSLAASGGGLSANPVGGFTS